MTIPNKFVSESTKVLDVKKLDDNFDYALSRIENPNGWNVVPEGTELTFSYAGTQVLKVKPGGVQFGDGSLQSAAAWDTFKYAQTFTASGNWTCPEGVYQVQLTMYGGGGNGAPGSTYSTGGTTFYSGGGGGGSSAVINNYRVAVVPGTTYAITVGAATLASSFGPLVSINPGVSGVAAVGSNTGDGGAGGAAYNVGTTYTSTDRTTTYPGSAAGNNGGTGTTSSNNNNGIGGAGGSLPIFSYAGGSPNNGSAAANTGAGGAGGNNGGAGGSGGSGLVIVQW